MIEQPKQTPYCCGQASKWVNPTLNLAYFYCEKCKKEVVEQVTEGIGWKPTDYADAIGAMRQVMANTSIPPSPTWGATQPWGGGPKLPDPPKSLPQASKFKVGDTVVFEYFLSIHKIRTTGVIEAITGGSYTVREIGTNFRRLRLESELTLVP